MIPTWMEFRTTNEQRVVVRVAEVVSIHEVQESPPTTCVGMSGGELFWVNESIVAVFHKLAWHQIQELNK